MRSGSIRAVLVFAAAAPLFSAEPLDIGNRRQLFIDHRFMASRKNVELKVHPPRKTGDIIVRSERPWTLGGYSCVLKDGDVYHLWYLVAGCVAYARSKDGIHWELPQAGTVEINGAARHNIVMGSGHGDVKGNVNGLMVFLDPNAPRDQRFRLVANPHDEGQMIQIFSSPDGVLWKRTYRNVLRYTDPKHHLDSQNTIIWDERLRKYVAFARRNLRRQGSTMRSIVRAESPTLRHFPDVEQCQVVFRPDAGDPEYGGVSAVDWYTNGVMRYPWADDVYLMFPAEYFHYGRYLGDFRGAAPVNAGALDTRLATSRDGIHWERYNRKPFVRLGMTGDFDARRIYISYGVAPALNGNELYMYYHGTSDTHGWGRNQANNDLLAKAGLAPTGPSAISRLVLRRDGFVSASAAYAGGEFTTPALRFSGRELVLNVDTSAAGTLRVEIQDPQGHPYPGFALADCVDVHTANSVNRVVCWRGASDVAPLAGKPVRLRFVFRDTDLYAFQFR
ncbi:MAG: hypothetical protein M1541_00275 [Acidobacteria bacterium]|nr:hypothetical protein [Acidobacteriota bacterium]